MDDNLILSAVETAKILGIFKKFCELNSKPEDKNRIRKYFSFSHNKEKTIKEIIRREQKIELNECECKRMVELITAYINKTSYRTPIDKGIKEKLLSSQNEKCAICGKSININAPADHIVPFKYVGDELDNNWQLLCTHCNSEKNAQLDYQIKYILKLV